MLASERKQLHQLARAPSGPSVCSERDAVHFHLERAEQAELELLG
jgi:hypothetical protein